MIFPADKSTIACAICASVFVTAAGPVAAIAIASTAIEAGVGRSMVATDDEIVFPDKLFPATVFESAGFAGTRTELVATFVTTGDIVGTSAPAVVLITGSDLVVVTGAAGNAVFATAIVFAVVTAATFVVLPFTTTGAFTAGAFTGGAFTGGAFTGGAFTAGAFAFVLVGVATLDCFAKTVVEQNAKAKKHPTKYAVVCVGLFAVI